MIDYYHDEEKSKYDEVPELNSEDKIKSVEMVVRPALDTPSALFHRLKFGLLSKRDNYGLVQQSIEKDSGADAKQTSAASARTSHVEELSVEEMKQMFERIRTTCGDKLVHLRSTDNEEDQQRAATALSYCMATVVGCKTEVKAFDAAVAKGSESDMETAFESISRCLENFQSRATPAMKAEAKAQAKNT